MIICPVCNSKMMHKNRTMCNDCHYEQGMNLQNELNEKARLEITERGLDFYLGLKVGDRIETIGDWHLGKHGIVTLLMPFNPESPIDDHGFIDVQFDSGEEENYVHWNWPTFLKIS